MLILVPTDYEAALLFPDLSGLEVGCCQFTRFGFAVGITGFGLAAAGVGASQSLSKYLDAGERVARKALLVGLGGSLSEVAAPVTSVVAGTSVICHGIGVGEGERFSPAAEMGWRQSESGDRMKLVVPRELDSVDGDIWISGDVVTVAGCSADLDSAARLARCYSGALVEEMEGFSVALACRSFGVQLGILRAISNIAGDRDKRKWRVEESLGVLRQVILQATGTSG